MWLKLIRSEFGMPLAVRMLASTTARLSQSPCPARTASAVVGKYQGTPADCQS